MESLSSGSGRSLYDKMRREGIGRADLSQFVVHPKPEPEATSVPQESVNLTPPPSAQPASEEISAPPLQQQEIPPQAEPTTPAALPQSVEQEEPRTTSPEALYWEMQRGGMGRADLSQFVIDPGAQTQETPSAPNVPTTIAEVVTEPAAQNEAEETEPPSAPDTPTNLPAVIKDEPMLPVVYQEPPALPTPAAEPTGTPEEPPQEPLVLDLGSPVEEPPAPLVLDLGSEEPAELPPPAEEPAKTVEAPTTSRQPEIAPVEVVPPPAEVKVEPSAPVAAETAEKVVAEVQDQPESRYNDAEDLYYQMRKGGLGRSSLDHLAIPDPHPPAVPPQTPPAVAPQLPPVVEPAPGPVATDEPNSSENSGPPPIQVPPLPTGHGRPNPIKGENPEQKPVQKPETPASPGSVKRPAAGIPAPPSSDPALPKVEVEDPYGILERHSQVQSTAETQSFAQPSAAPKADPYAHLEWGQIDSSEYYEPYFGNQASQSNNPVHMSTPYRPQTPPPVTHYPYYSVYPSWMGSPPSFGLPLMYSYGGWYR